MLTRHIEVKRTARYHVLGDPERDWDEVWYVLHGYGQRADAFLDACGALAAPGRLVVAPEGLSRFYARGTNGQVGASWMTKEDREQEIQDYVSYLDAVHCAMRDTRPGRAKARIGVLGFSQGTATAARWCVLGKIRASRLVLWGSGFPPDLDPAEAGESLREVQVELVLGEADPYFDGQRGTAEVERLQSVVPHAVEVSYAGAHEIDAKTLAGLATLPAGGLG